MPTVRLLLAGSLVLGGILFAAVGIGIGPEATYSLVVEEPFDEEDRPDSLTEVEYDDLEPRIQDAFRQALETGEDAALDGPPEGVRQASVTYRESQYLTYVEVGDANRTRMAAYIAVGVVLIVAGGLIRISPRVRRGGTEGDHWFDRSPEQLVRAGRTSDDGGQGRIVRHGKTVAVVLLIATGIALTGFGAMTGTDGQYWIEVVDETGSDELESSDEVIEYDRLEPPIQDAFRESIETGELVPIDRPPKDFRDGYVHYRDSTYAAEIAVADAGQSRMLFWIAAGSVSVLGGVGIWYVSRRRRHAE